MKTLISHRPCATPIFLVDRKLESGDAIEAHEWHPINDMHSPPAPGDAAVCPHCGERFAFRDESLLREYVDVV